MSSCCSDCANSNNNIDNNNSDAYKAVQTQGVILLDDPSDTKIEFNKFLTNFKNIVVHRAHIEGAPTLAGIPQDPFFVIKMEGYQSPQLHTNIGVHDGMVIPLTGVDNYMDFNSGFLFVKHSQDNAQRSTNISVLRPNGEPAVFDRLTLFYKVTENYNVRSSWQYTDNSNFTVAQRNNYY